MKAVDDNEENIAICKQFCGPCPTFKLLKRLRTRVVVALVAQCFETMSYRAGGSACMESRAENSSLVPK
jgi:hypothetical protein